MELVVRNLNKIYKNLVVVKNFTYTFKNGIYLLLGENGKGKSTILKMLSKAIRPSLKDYYISPLKIVMLCERVELSNGNVIDYLKKISRLNYIKTDFKELLKKWHIPNKAMNSLSKGNKQKVGILMTYLTDADVYLFDEATDALDQQSIKTFKEFILELKESGKIVIICTHEKKYFMDMECIEVLL